MTHRTWTYELELAAQHIDDDAAWFVAVECLTALFEETRRSVAGRLCTEDTH